MFTLIAENEYGEQLELTHNTAYSISSIDGIDPPDATINTTHNAGEDGNVFNSSYIGERTITITLAINAPAENNRINLYHYFKSKRAVRLYYTNSTRNVYIDRYVQTVGIAYFDRKQTAQIVIKCPRPLFNSATGNINEFSSIESLFEFPFSIAEAGIEFSSLNIGEEKDIINGGDVETGVQITIRMLGSVTTPKIYNVETNEFFIINGTYTAGDVITINTVRGQKQVTLLSNGVTSNLIGQLEEGSTWFTLIPGDNVFTTAANAQPENMLITFTITDLFEGV